MITLISEEQVKATAVFSEIVAAVETAYRDCASGLIVVPDRITLAVRGSENSCIFLAANHLARPYYALKQASSFPTNRTQGLPTVLSDIHLYSADTGQPLAVLSANWLTALKTGAASAVATKYLSIQKPLVLALIGCGLQARTQLSGVLAVRAVKEIRLYDLVKAKADEMRREIDSSGANGVVSVFEDPNLCVDGADVICTSTTSMTPVFDGCFLKNGCHINAVGSFTPEMQEIDSQAVVRAQKVVVDVEAVAWQVAGDLLVPLAEGLIDKTKIHAELGAIVNGSRPGRESDSEITIYESLGFAALDLAVTVAIYEKSLQTGVGRRVDW
jgi:ornithine cyclodeaminase/alanine dehydrogenase-like protein (mu-crystallin family)